MCKILRFVPLTYSFVFMCSKIAPKIIGAKNKKLFRNVHGMWQNFCYRNDSCNSKIWNLGTLENKGIPFLKKFFFWRNTIPVTNGGSGDCTHFWAYSLCLTTFVGKPTCPWFIKWLYMYYDSDNGQIFNLEQVDFHVKLVTFRCINPHYDHADNYFQCH